ncbi:hypothetical protein EcloH_0558 [Enterobacter ludwigii]|nr:hypothetical protein EcloH_0558 [Enterobacter ludwigii]
MTRFSRREKTNLVNSRYNFSAVAQKIACYVKKGKKKTECQAFGRIRDKQTFKSE